MKCFQDESRHKRKMNLKVILSPNLKVILSPHYELLSSGFSLPCALHSVRSASLVSDYRLLRIVWRIRPCAGQYIET